MTDVITSTSSSADRDGRTGRFQTGNRISVGQGRPRGSRALLSDVFLADMYEAWQRDGASALARVAADDPSTFVKIAASIMPRQIEAEVSMFADVPSFAEAFSLAVATIGGDAATAMRRLSRRDRLLIESDATDD